MFPLKLKVTCDLGKSYCLKKCHYYLIASDVVLRAAVLEISRSSWYILVMLYCCSQVNEGEKFLLLTDTEKGLIDKSTKYHNNLILLVYIECTLNIFFRL